MQNVPVFGEEDFKKWMKEVITDCIAAGMLRGVGTSVADEPLLNREQIAAFLNISLVTLHAWMKKGLPYHKQPGKVYFFKSEVVEFVKSKGRTGMLATVAGKMSKES